MLAATAFQGFYGTLDGEVIVRVINEGEGAIKGEPAELYKVAICRLGAAFAGGGSSVGREIIKTDQVLWVRKSRVTRNRKGQKGILWN